MIILIIILIRILNSPGIPEKTETEPIPEVTPPVVAVQPQIVEPQRPAIHLLKPFEGDYPFNQGFHSGHTGVDWGTHYYTQILAADAGTATLHENDLYGKHVWITHAWGKTLYAHLDWFLVDNGQQVERGTVIAQSGDTGDSFDHDTGIRSPHLHFSVMVDGAFKNPIDYL